VYRTFKEFLLYNAVGIVNTIVGFGLVFLLMANGMDAKESNLLGYMVGMVVSYLLNSKYTFKEGLSFSLALKFFAALFVSYLLNFMLLSILLPYMNAYLAQLFSGIVYTLSSFFLVKYMVFRTVDASQ